LLSHLGIFAEKLADANLTPASLVTIGRIPVGNPPFNGLPQEELIRRKIEHPAQGKTGNVDSGLTKRPDGNRGVGGLRLLPAHFSGCLCQYLPAFKQRTRPYHSCRTQELST